VTADPWDREEPQCAGVGGPRPRVEARVCTHVWLSPLKDPPAQVWLIISFTVSGPAFFGRLRKTMATKG
jgi:hypothetical protein